MYNHSELCKNIKKYRELNEFSVTDLANKIGVTKQFISSLEAGNGKSVTLETLFALSTALNVNVDDLLGNEKITDKGFNPYLYDLLCTYSSEEIDMLINIVNVFYKNKIIDKI